MNLKEKVLQTLMENKIISGEQMAKMFNVSRAAIWKVINTLKQEGYEINGKSNQGYYLNENSTFYSKAYLEKYLKQDFHIDIFTEVDSTSTYLKKLVDVEKKPCLCIALKQSLGRGRTGKSFYSPLDGLYFSFSFKVTNNYDLSLITIKVAVAAMKAIKEILNINTKVKWVNDLYYQNKKVCGILTEAIMDYESLKVDSIIIGLGLNLYLKELPNDLKDIVTSLNVSSCNKNLLIATIINNFFKKENKDETIKYYKEHCILINKDITYQMNNQKYQAKAIDIDNEGHLIVINQNKEINILKSGEVSLGSINYEK